MVVRFGYTPFSAMPIPLIPAAVAASALLAAVFGKKKGIDAATAPKPPPTPGLETERATKAVEAATGVPQVLIAAQVSAGLPTVYAGVWEQSKAISNGATMRSLSAAENALMTEYIKVMEGVIGEDAPVPGAAPAPATGLLGLSYEPGGLGINHYGYGSDLDDLDDLAWPGEGLYKKAKKKVKKAAKKAKATVKGAVKVVKDPVGTGKTIAKGAVKGAEVVGGAAKAAGKTAYRVGKDVVTWPFEAGKTLKKMASRIDDIEFADVKKIAKAAFNAIKEFAEDAIRAILRQAVAPLAGLLKTLVQQLLPAAVPIGGGAVLARVWGSTEQLQKLPIAESIIRYGAEYLVAKTIDQIPIPSIAKPLWNRMKKPFRTALVRGTSLVGVAAGSGKIEEVAAAIAGVGVLTPVSVLLAKVLNLVISLAISTASKIAVSAGEEEIRKALRKAGVGRDATSKAVVDLMITSLKSGLAGDLADHFAGLAVGDQGDDNSSIVVVTTDGLGRNINPSVYRRPYTSPQPIPRIQGISVR